MTAITLGILTYPFKEVQTLKKIGNAVVLSQSDVSIVISIVLGAGKPQTSLRFC